VTLSQDVDTYVKVVDVVVDVVSTETIVCV